MAHRSIPSQPAVAVAPLPPAVPGVPIDDGAEPIDLVVAPALGGLPLGRSDLVRQVASLAGAAAVLAVVGWWLLRPAAAPLESTLPMAGGATASPSGTEAAAPPSNNGSGDGPVATSTTAVPAPLVVQAAGAVQSPGVYRLDGPARVDDLIRAAGGFAPGADRDRVNLAALLVDGERIWIPQVGQDQVPDVVVGAGGGAGASGPAGGAGSDPATPASPVDLNAATADQLDALPGVGPATAAAILSYRDTMGRFASVDDLLEVRGIGEAKLEQLRPLVRV